MKPGHTHNTNFAKKIRDLILKDMKTTAPLVDFNEKPFYNKHKLRKYYHIEILSYLLMR